MTDDRREDVRRSEDQSLSGKLDDHIEDFNEFKSVLLTGEFVLPSGITANEAVEEHAALHDGQDRILDVLMGPEVEQMDGTKLRNKSLGLVAKVEQIDNRLINGGLKVKLPAGLWALLAVITSSVAGIIITMIQRI